jgi:iron complex outermembrane receptor protein
MRGIHNRKIHLLCTLPVALLAAPAWAQTATPPASPPAAGTPPEAAAATTNGEEILVYGRKRPETVFKSPVAVTALNEQALKQQSISQITDLSRVAPNVIIRQSSSGGGDIQAEIRGQIIAISNPSVDGPIGIYLDDAIVAEGRGLLGSAFDLQSVEIARGVQGTLSGRNNTGGAIRFYTAKPVLGERSLEFSGSYGSHGLHREEAIANVPITDTLAMRFGFQNSYRDPLGHDVVTGAPVQSINQQLYRASLKWQPSSSFTTTIAYDHSRINEDSVAFHPVKGSQASNSVISCTKGATNINGACYPASVVLPDGIYDVSTADPYGKDRVHSDFVRGTADYQFSDHLDGKVTVGYRTLSAFQDNFDFDYTPALNNLSSNFGAKSKQFTVEPQLTGKFFDDKLTLVGGYFHFDDKAAQLVNGGVRVGIPFPVGYGFVVLKIDDQIHNTSDAGYLHGEYKITPAWTFAAGVRYTNDDREVTPLSHFDNTDPRSINYAGYLAGTTPASTCSVSGPSGNLNPTGPCPNDPVRVSYHYWSYEASTRYEISDQLAVYARTGRGQKSGGFSSPVMNTTIPPFKPEQVTDYEVGVKANRLADGLINFNLALYYSDYKNMQRLASTLLPSGVAATEVFNVGTAHIKGVEFDTSIHPTHALTLSGFFGYTDAQYKKFVVTGTGGQTVDLSNQRFYQTPKFTGRAAAQYDWDLTQGKISLNGGWTYQSSTSMYLFTYAATTQKAFGLFDARLSYAPSDKWEIAVWGTNLANKRYFQAATVSAANNFNPSAGYIAAAVIPGDSREVAGTVTVRF